MFMPNIVLYYGVVPNSMIDLTSFITLQFLRATRMIDAGVAARRLLLASLTYFTASLSVLPAFTCHHCRLLHYQRSIYVSLPPQQKQQH